MIGHSGDKIQQQHLHIRVYIGKDVCYLWELIANTGQFMQPINSINNPKWAFYLRVPIYSI